MCLKYDAPNGTVEDIDDIRNDNPSRITTVPFGYREGPQIDHISQLLSPIEHWVNPDKDVMQIHGVSMRLFEIFKQYDCYAVEIESLQRRRSSQDSDLEAVGTKMHIDDYAAFRQPRLFAMRNIKLEHPDEVRAERSSLVFIRSTAEGDKPVGTIGNGAGLAMGLCDIIYKSGVGYAANFLDTGGRATPETVTEAFRLVLRIESVKVMLINLYCGILRADKIAEGIVMALKELDVRIPIVVRIKGNNEALAADIVCVA